MGRTLAAAGIIGGTLLVYCLQATGGQDAEADLPKRVAQLEKKVAGLERLLLARSPSSADNVTEAAAKLAAAEHELRYTRQLHEKGYVTETQLHADGLAVAMARAALERAKAAHSDVEKILDIEVLEAEHNLSVATERLEFTERLAAKGYAGEDQLKAGRFKVEKARKELQRAEARLEAHRQSPRQAPNDGTGD